VHIRIDAGSCPGRGQGPIVVAVVAGINNVTLLSADPDGDDLLTRLVSAPSAGSLTTVYGASVGLGDVVHDPERTQSKRLYYVPTDFDHWTEDAFNFTVSDGGGVFMRPPRFPSCACMRVARLGPNVSSHSRVRQRPHLVQ
jgi:hypothetical protein